MNRVTVDAQTQAKLSNFSERVELYDESGRMLGMFTPILGPEKIKELADECPFSEEELEELRKQRTGRPLSEILNDLNGQ